MTNNQSEDPRPDEATCRVPADRPVYPIGLVKDERLLIACYRSLKREDQEKVADMIKEYAEVNYGAADSGGVYPREHGQSDGAVPGQSDQGDQTVR